MTLHSSLTLAACAAVTSLAVTPAAAETLPLERMLRDGRILAAPAQVEGCEAPMITGNTRSSMGMEFVCQVPIDGQTEAGMAGVGLVLLTLPIMKNSHDFLVEQSGDWWPDTAPEARGERIVDKTKMLGEEAVDMECISREMEGAPAVIVCVMKSDALQFMTSGRAATLETAEKGLNAVLAGFSLRDAEPQAVPETPAAAEAPAA